MEWRSAPASIGPDRCQSRPWISATRQILPAAQSERRRRKTTGCGGHPVLPLALCNLDRTPSLKAKHGLDSIGHVVARARRIGLVAEPARLRRTRREPRRHFSGVLIVAACFLDSAGDKDQAGVYRTTRLLEQPAVELAS